MTAMGLALVPSNAVSQQKSLKEQLVGTWTLVSSDQVRPDGSKLKQFGANPKGINVFDANGRFFLMVASADNSRIAARDPNETNQEDVGGEPRFWMLETIREYMADRFDAWDGTRTRKRS